MFHLVCSFCFLLGTGNAGTHSQDTLTMSPDILPVPEATADRPPVTDNAAIRMVSWETLRKLLNEPNDTTYVINFWATFCKPCVAELPHFDKLQSAYQYQKVRILLVSMDFIKDFENRVIPFVRERGLQSQVWLLKETNAGQWIDEIDPGWSGALPATVFVHPGQKQRRFYNKEFNMEELRAEFELFYKKLNTN